MKTLNTLLLILFATLTTVASAQQFKSHILYLKNVKEIPAASENKSTLRAVAVNPDETLYFVWNTALTQWDTVSLSFNTYNSSNLLTSVLTMDYSYPAAKFDTSNSMAYTYNANGDITEVLYKDYMNNTWVNSMKDVFIYNNKNHLTESLTYYWFNNSWELLEGDKSIITYDNNGLIIKEEMEYYEMSTTSWEKYQMNDIFYPSGVPMPDSIVTYIYDNNTWVIDGKMVNITWHDFSKYLFSSYDIVMMDNGSWEEPMRVVMTYNLNDQLTNMVYKMSFMGNFVDFMKYTFTYDSYGNETENKVETMMTGTWEVMGNEITTYTYDSNGNMLTSEAKVFDNSTGNWYNTDKFHYKYNGTSTGVEDLETETLKVFPNPFKSSISVSVEDFGDKELTVTIFDMAGKLILKQQISDRNTQTLELGDLRNGVYFLNISSIEKAKTIKIIKQ